MDRHLTRQGALNVTKDLDKISSLIQHHHAVLGIPAKVALDFAWKCDVLSDAIEKRAISNDKVHGVTAAEGEEDEGEGKEAAAKNAAPEFAKPPKNETGGSVEPTGEKPSWDPNAIGDDVGGPHKSEADEASYMGGNFSQQENHQLRDKQQSGQVPKVDPPSRTAKDSLARLAKMVAANGHEQLRSLSDRLKGCVAKLEASKADGVGPLVAGAKKQIAALDQLADEMIKLDSTGEGNPELLLAADNVQQAVGEILPHLEMVEASSADQSSPTAMLEHEQLLEDGTIVKLVNLAGKITDEAMKSLKGPAKEASAKKAGDDAEEEAEEAEEEAEEAEEEAEEAEEEAEEAESDVEAGKKSAKKLGYDLFAA